MQKRVEEYILGYTPNGNGRYKILLEGDPTPVTGVLGPAEFAALAAILNQKNVMYDPQRNIFYSMNRLAFSNNINPLV